MNREVKNQWDTIVSYMNDEIREDVHGDLAPCKAGDFLQEYCNRDSSFETLLSHEFGIGNDETTRQYFNQI